MLIAVAWDNLDVLQDLCCFPNQLLLSPCVQALSFGRQTSPRGLSARWVLSIEALTLVPRSWDGGR